MYQRKKSIKRSSVGPVRASRRGARRAKKLLIGAGILIFVVLAAFGFWKLSAVFFVQGGPSWAQWRLKEIIITGASEDTNYEVLKHIGFSEGDAITARDAGNLQNMLRAALRQLSEVKVRRGIFSKNLKVKVKKHAPIARVLWAQKTLYLAPGGQLFADSEQEQNAALLPLTFESEIKSDFLPQELVKLIVALNASQTLQLEAARANGDLKTFGLILGGGTAVDMGPWQNGQNKITALSQVLAAAGGKNLRLPYEIDFNYFPQGKVYLKEATGNGKDKLNSRA